MKTTNRLISGICVEVLYDDKLIPKTDINWFLNYIDSTLVGNGCTDRPLMLQIGMMLVKIEDVDGISKVFEPDMANFPINFIKGVTHTLQILRRQKDTYESLEISAEISFPNLRQYVTQCREWEDTHSYVLERNEPSDNDSGWYIGCQNPEHNHEDASNLKFTSVYEFALDYHEIVPLMALPPGTTVLLENDHPHVCFAGEEKLPKEGSFLSRLLMEKLR